MDLTLLKVQPNSPKNDGFKLFNDQYKNKEISKKNFQDHKKIGKI